MAHKNIDDRRGWLRLKMEQSANLTVSLTDETAALFGCSTATIRTDWQTLHLERIRSEYDLLPGKTTLSLNIKKIVTARDGNICQYCERDAGVLAVFEHVIPAAWGGVAESKNIVIACCSCNAAKGRGVWIPHNFYSITACDLAWRRLAINLQRKGKENNGRCNRKKEVRTEEATRVAGAV